MQSETLLVLVNVPTAEWSFPVGEERQLVGRSADAKIQIPANHRSVSRRHAEIWSEKRKICMRDLGSRGGTRVNGVWLKTDEPACIMVGDRITLGRAELRLVPAFYQNADSSTGTAAARDACNVTAVFELPQPLVARSLLQTLSYTEHDVVLWIARGYVNDEDLSRLLYRSPNTIRTQISSILKKLNLRSRMCILNELQKEGAALRICPITEE